MRLWRIFVIIFLFFLVGLLAWHNLGSINQDIGRHLKSGQIIWETKNVYNTNLFSFTEPSHLFINHHWLSEVIFWRLYLLVGLKGLIAFKVLTILASFGLIWLAVYRQTGLRPWLVAMPLGLLVFLERTDVRPEIFSYLFLSFFLWATLRAKYQKDYRWLWFLPILQIAWTNLHIYFVLGPGLLLLFLIDCLTTSLPRAIKNKIWLVTALTGLATLINPSFLKGALMPLTIMNHYGYTVVENQSVAFLQNYGLLLKSINFFEGSAVILAISFLLALKNSRKNITFEFLTALVFAILGFKMIRNFGLYALATTPILALNLKTVPWPAWSQKIRPKIIISLIFLLLGGWWAKEITNNHFYQWLRLEREFGLGIPRGAQGGIDFIRKNHVAGPVFNNFDVGSFLIWKLYPEQKVFVDGRPEAYSPEFFEKIYKPMQADPALWKKYSEQYGINYIFFDHHDITPWAQSFLQNITKNPQWVPVYLDASVITFIKNIPVNQELIKKYPLVI